MHPVVKAIQTDLRRHIDPIYRKGATRFFKEQIIILGVRVPIARRIGRERYADVKNLSKRELFSIAEELLQTKEQAASVIALQWVEKREKEFAPSDFAIFERWMKKYVTNWATCDDFCGGPLGKFLVLSPAHIAKTKIWAASKNRWLRRASVVSLIYGVRKKYFLKQIFAFSDILLHDSDDLVQKGYGWALKEASNRFPGEVLSFVEKRKKQMPRTALRYAIEKYPKEIRRHILTEL